MFSPPSVTLDASLFAIPDINCREEELVHYIKSLLEWKQLLDAKWLKILMSQRASSALFEENLYPSIKILSDLLTHCQTKLFDVQTINTFVNKLLNLTPSFETYFHLKDILYDKIETIPDILSLMPNKHLQDDLARLCILIAFLRTYHYKYISSHALIFKNAPDSTIEVTAQIELIEYSRDDIPDFTSEDLFKGDLIVCTDFCGFIESIDESAILINATEDEDISLAVRIALYKDLISRSLTPDWDRELITVIGKQFRKTCHKSCCEDKELSHMVLKSVVKIVKSPKGGKLHRQRKSKSGNAEVLRRESDDAEARRCWITGELRLLYWLRLDGKIDLNKVGHHDEIHSHE
ncbi:MAG: hypothetical protein LBG48_04505 [Rickettsiales bacterium]|jgi:hypothetical protein|nr:hypothetical protein [Rickettsiales bacterium]